MNKNQIILKRIARNAIVLALYVALTFATYPLSYINLQFRISEILVLLCFFNRDYIIAITLGCLLTNIASPMMPWDLLIGTLATFLSCLFISFMKQLGLAALLVIILNSFIVGAEYYFILNQPYFLSVGEVALGESIALIASYILCLLIMKKPKIQQIVDVKRNADFKW